MGGALLDRRLLLAGLAGAAASPLLAAAPARKMIAAPGALPGQPDARLWDPPVAPVGEIYAPGPNGQVYVRVYGRPQRTPVIVIPGGPGAGHRYMRPYGGLSYDRQVALYDQSGSGKSSKPADPRRYTLAAWLEELDGVRRILGFPQAILVGHATGGMLAAAYAAQYPGRVAALVLAGTLARTADYGLAADRWLAEMGPDAVATAKRAAAGKTDDPAYGPMLQRYNEAHLLRLRPWPAWFVNEGATLAANPVFRSHAFDGLDLTPQLPKLTMPSLVTCGEYDVAAPWLAQGLAKGLGDAPMLIFDGLSHMAHIEDPARVVRATGRWLRLVSPT